VRVHVISDVHGRVDGLREAGDGADALLCLGDLLCFVDYSDYSAGVMGELLGREAVARFVELRTARRFDEAREFVHSLWSGREDQRDGLTEEAIRRQYARLFGAMGRPVYATYGNVDRPALWPEFTGDGITVLDGQTLELGGRTFGFVGGGLRTRYHTPYEVDDEEYAAKIVAVGEVDVLCCHIPPDVPELLYDVVARRFERGSQAVLEAIAATSPRLVLFGHVHQPLQRRMRIGRTECVNVGHFRATGQPFAIEW
jgi:Icc-related predicted phosphoesterase